MTILLFKAYVLIGALIPSLRMWSYRRWSRVLDRIERTRGQA